MSDRANILAIAIVASTLTAPIVATAVPPCYPSEGGRFTFYPMAGQFNRDIFGENYVDLDASTNSLEYWDCVTNDSAIGHTGHDVAPLTVGGEQHFIPIFAALDGEVLDAVDGWPDCETGPDCLTPANSVTIDHGNGRISYYSHLRMGSVSVGAGQFVRAGEQIGLMGSSSTKFRPHLHWETSDYGQLIEPFSGPCRAGPSEFADQPFIDPEFWIGDIGFYTDPADWHGWESPLPRTGHIARSDPTFTVWVYLYNIPADGGDPELNPCPLNTSPCLSYELVSSNGTTTYATQSLAGDEEFRRTFRRKGFALPGNPPQLGEWQFRIYLNGELELTVPFLVVAGSADIQNRAPEPITVRLDPPNPSEADVLVCSVEGDALLSDLDYDLLRYEYVWTVDSNEMRSVTSAASSDAIQHHFAPAGAVVKCEVTPMDMTTAGVTASVEATIAAANGACCHGGGSSCTSETEFNCIQAGGTYFGDGTLCADDWDGDGVNDRCSTDPIVVYVDHQALGLADGASWGDAFQDLDEALCLGAELGGRGIPVQIWVAGGVYYPMRSDNPADARSASFGLRNNVELFGGFAGTENFVQQRDVQTNPTILSGDIGTNGDSSDNCYHVLVGSGCDRTSVIDGFTITKGNANGVTGLLRHGGGLLIRGGRPTIRNCTFELNQAVIGGAVSCLPAQSGTFSSDPSFEGCVFDQNTATSRGGAIHENDTSPKIEDCMFSSNSAPNGAAFYSDGGRSRIVHSTLDQNIANWRGGGIYVREGGAAEIVSCQFLANRGTTSGAEGGAVALIASQVHALNCLFVANEVSASGGLGGAVYANSNSFGDFANCTWSQNQASSAGHAIYARDTAAINIVNSIVWEHVSPTSTSSGSATIDFNHSIVEGGWQGGMHVLDVDPDFVDSQGQDFELTLGSPAIDAASFDAYFIARGGSGVDLNRDVRLQDVFGAVDTGSGAVAYLDMGAFEFQGSVPGDCSSNGTLELDDFTDLESCLLGPDVAGCQCFDVNRDGDSDLADFAILQALFGD